MDITKIILTFSSTTKAMVFEQVATTKEIPGRLIPTPPQIKAGCGFAWLIETSKQEQVLETLKELATMYDELHLKK